MSSRPPFIESPVDSSSWDFRLDCMAFELYTKKTPAERAEFIGVNKKLQTEDFTERLRRVQAWWMLTYLTRYQIECDLAGLTPAEEEKMRTHLNVMKTEIKKHRQIEFKTNPRGKNHA